MVVAEVFSGPVVTRRAVNQAVQITLIWTVLMIFHGQLYWELGLFEHNPEEQPYMDLLATIWLRFFAFGGAACHLAFALFQKDGRALHLAFAIANGLSFWFFTYPLGPGLLAWAGVIPDWLEAWRNYVSDRNWATLSNIN